MDDSKLRKEDMDESQETIIRENGVKMLRDINVRLMELEEKKANYNTSTSTSDGEVFQSQGVQDVEGNVFEGVGCTDRASIREKVLSNDQSGPADNNERIGAVHANIANHTNDQDQDGKQVPSQIDVNQDHQNRSVTPDTELQKVADDDDEDSRLTKEEKTPGKNDSFLIQQPRPSDVDKKKISKEVNRYHSSNKKVKADADADAAFSNLLLSTSTSAKDNHEEKSKQGSPKEFTPLWRYQLPPPQADGSWNSEGKAKQSEEDLKSRIQEVCQYLEELLRINMLKNRNILLENKLGLLQEYQRLLHASFDGKLEWTIDDVQFKIWKASKLGRFDGIDSPVFYYYMNGYRYKMRLRLFFNGERIGFDGFVSIYVVLLENFADNVMPWPFSLKALVKLVDQADVIHPFPFTLDDPGGVEKKKDIFGLINPEPASDDQRAYQSRPYGEESPYIGYECFCPTTSLFAREGRYMRYIRDDKIIIRAKVFGGNTNRYWVIDPFKQF